MTRSQAVTTYGVGSVFEFRTFGAKSTLQSVVVRDHLLWGMQGAEGVVREPVLQRTLGKRFFRLPPDGTTKAAVAVSRFPRTLVCNRCQALGTAPREFDDDGKSSPRCRKQKCTGKGIPARLVAACYCPDPATPDTQPGHIEDFPWAWWAHTEEKQMGDGKAVAKCTDPVLKLLTTKGVSGLQGLRVHCVTCNRGRSLAGVFGDGALRGCHCRGNRPWLDGHVSQEKGCNRPLRALQRGASNLYFPVHASALSIPPYSQQLFALLSDAFDIIAGAHQLPQGLMIQMLRNGRPELEDYSDDQIITVIRALANLDDDSVVDQAEQRERERRAFLEGADEKEFAAEEVEVPEDMTPYVSKISAVHRLREVRVLRGFHRTRSELGADSWTVSCAPLSASVSAEWLPAIEVRGEGVYFELNANSLSEWAEKPEVAARARLISERLPRREEAGSDSLATPALLLIHTVTHLLMKQLALESGYSLASLRERLYCGVDSDGEAYAGALIYTATPASEGTLGGLVANAEPEVFRNMVLATVAGAQWCSSDPLCSESEGQGADGLNLAACHACCLTSETSCEHRNVLLDRALVVGAPLDASVGFFSELL